MRSGLALLAVSSLFGVGLSHICMYDPPQRGGYDIDGPGESLCYKKVGPCGGEPSGEVQATLVGGSSYTVQFQQNLNHFNRPVASSPELPGYLDASIAFNSNPSEEDFVPFGASIPDYNAMNQITQTNFSITGLVPDVECDNCVMRVRYVSNNKGENDRGEIFYQCSDIAISSSSQSLQPADILSKVEVEEEGSPCCTAPVWEGSFTSTGWREVTEGYVAYDATQELMRVDVVVGEGKGIDQTSGNFHMYMNFSSGLQWLHNVNNNTCDAYGLDMWFEWCYGGSDYAQKFEETFTIAGVDYDVWSTGDFRFINSVSPCRPVSLARVEQAHDTTKYSNVKDGVEDAETFTPPPLCSRGGGALVASGAAGTDDDHLFGKLLASGHVPGVVQSN